MNKSYMATIVQLLRKERRDASNLPTYISMKEMKRVISTITWFFNQSSHRPLFLKLGNRIIQLWVKSGPKFVVNYLKEAHIAVMKFIANDTYQVATNGTRVQVDHNRLPAFIPLDLRKLMLTDVRCMRAVLTVLSLYRVIPCEGKVDFMAITATFNGVDPVLPHGELVRALNELPKLPPMKDPQLLTLLTAGPNHEWSVLGLVWDSFVLFYNKTLYSSMTAISKHLGSKIHIWIGVYALLMTPIIGCLRLLGWKKLLCAGRLSVKTEAAGKRRVFAITDGWTQSLLAPLHKSLFSLLKQIPTDGTFDQNKPLRSLSERFRGQPMWSFDLKSATDRLPVSLQVAILSILISPEFATNWSDVLVGREWFYKGIPYRYSVGQPMGALSSWAMLALTHHVIVRVAANRVGISKFHDYAILGDDVVIANAAVADSYLVIMSDLGVEISSHKSLVSSNGTCEFAKRLIGLQEYTPLGATLVVLASRHWSYFPNLFIDAENKGYHLTADTISHQFQTYPLTLFKEAQVRKILVSLIGPGGFFAKSWSSITSMENWTQLNIEPSVPVSTWILAGQMAESHRIQKYLIDVDVTARSFSFVDFKIMSHSNSYYKMQWYTQAILDILQFTLYVPTTLIRGFNFLTRKLRLTQSPLQLIFYNSLNDYLSLVSPGPYLLFHRLKRAKDETLDSVNNPTDFNLFGDFEINILNFDELIRSGFTPSVSLDLTRSVANKTMNYFDGPIKGYVKFIHGWDMTTPTRYALVKLDSSPNGTEPGSTSPP